MFAVLLAQPVVAFLAADAWGFPLTWVWLVPSRRQSGTTKRSSPCCRRCIFGGQCCCWEWSLFIWAAWHIMASVEETA